MDKEHVIEYFSRLAPNWDANATKDADIVNLILDNAMIGEGKDVLDVACGTGILIPDYLERGAASVTGIDITDKMAEIARSKFPQKEVEIICGDVEETDFGRAFDCIVVYNAFPHFPDPERIVSHLSSFLRPGGTLTVAHGMSREKINSHKNGKPGNVSNGLIAAEDLVAVFGKYLTVTTVISDDRMYQVTGCKK